MTDKNILVIYSNTNTGKKHDASGAFIPEAKAFAKLHGVLKENIVGIKCPRVKKSTRRSDVYTAIEVAGYDQKLDAIAMFFHGWPRGIQPGFNRSHIPKLVEVMSQHCNPNVKITLYACLAAENDVRDKQTKNLGPATDGGFCDVLRDEMVRKGFTAGHVDGHKTAGHSGWNPYLVRFLCDAVEDPEIGGLGGHWLVAPGSQFWKPWVKALKNKEGGLRYRFPYMDELDIKAELMGARIVNMEELEVRGRRW